MLNMSSSGLQRNPYRPWTRRGHLPTPLAYELHWTLRLILAVSDIKGQSPTISAFY
jgi:hypothetical protein